MGGIDMTFSGKIILIGSEGLIGRSVAPKLETLGFNILRVDISNGFDISQKDVRSQLFMEHNDAKYLVNLFGYNDHIDNERTKSNILSTDSSEIRPYNFINVEILYDVCRDFSLTVINPESIVNFGSLYSELSPRTDIYGDTCKAIGYTISKHAVIGLTRQLASHLAPITRVNAISPGGVIANQPQDFIDRYNIQAPMKRMINADEIAGPIAFLCSSLSSYVTGHNLKVDGGWSII